MLQARSTTEARARLEMRAHLVADALSSLLIGVTEFWRDASVFDAFGTAVVPALAERGGRLRVWSAGCSTGEELYTVAILLAEAGLLARSDLVGTDCRTDAIERAVASTYAASSLDAVPAAIRLRYFEPAGDGESRPISSLRARVRWRVADLLREVERGPWDVVLWRNTAIYLNQDAATRIFTSLISQLSPGGFLVVGKAERAPAAAPVTSVCRCIYRKAGGTHARQ